MTNQKCFTNTKNVSVLQNNLSRKELQYGSDKKIGSSIKYFNYRKCPDLISKCNRNEISTLTEENKFGATVQFFWKHNSLHQGKTKEDVL